MRQAREILEQARSNQPEGVETALTAVACFMKLSHTTRIERVCYWLCGNRKAGIRVEEALRFMNERISAQQILLAMLAWLIWMRDIRPTVKHCDKVVESMVLAHLVLVGVERSPPVLGLIRGRTAKLRFGKQLREDRRGAAMECATRILYCHPA